MKHKFSPQERLAVYTVHGKRCYLCKAPIDLNNMQVDHIIPESFEGDVSGFEKIKKDYGLDESFDLNSFQNWLPSCSSCNNLKSNKLFRPVPKLLLLLNQAKSKADEAEHHCKKTHSKQTITRCINILKSVKIEDIDLKEKLKVDAYDSYTSTDEEMFYDALFSMSNKDKTYFTDQVVKELFDKLNRLIEGDFSRLSKYLWLFLFYEHNKGYSAERKFEEKEEFILNSILEHEKPLSRTEKELFSKLVLKTEDSEFLIL